MDPVRIIFHRKKKQTNYRGLLGATDKLIMIAKESVLGFLENTKETYIYELKIHWQCKALV